MADEQQPAFDPWQVLQSEDQARAAGDRERTALKEQKRLQEEAWNGVWKRAIEELSPEAFVELGRLLRERDAVIWVDELKISLLREWLICPPANLRGVMQENATRIANLRLISAAATENEATIERELARSGGPDGRLRMVLQPYLWDRKTEIDARMSGDFVPATPLMTAAELARAAGGRIEGFSQSNVSTMLSKGVLLQDKKVEVDGRSSFCRFRHRDPRTHLDMLRHAVRHLNSLKKIHRCKGPLLQLWALDSGQKP